MGLEILVADLVPSSVNDANEQDTDVLPEKEKSVKLSQGKDLEEPVKFGLVDSTQATNGQTKAEVDNAKRDNFPKDAVEEWPEPKQIHTFYFVKYQSYEDSKLKAKLEQVDKEIQKRTKERFQITEALKSKRIQSLHYRIQHESNTLAEEKLLLKDIKQLEGTRQKVIANAAMRAKLQDSLGPKEAIQDQVKLIGVDLDGVRKDQQMVRAKIRSLEEDLKSTDEEISSLQEELTAATLKKDKAYETLNELRKTRDEGNACYYQNRSLLNNARDLAAKKDIAALGKLCHDEVGKFMSQWGGNKAFRDDYERRILSSLDRRQLSRDGTMRNPDEQPILLEALAPVELETSMAKLNVKNIKENVAVPAQHTTSQKVPKDGGNKIEIKERSTPEDTENFTVSERKQPLETPKIDAAKLKDIKREEEIAKAKLAEREKRAKKKAGSVSDNAEEPTDVDTKAEEPQEAEEVNDAQIPPEVKEQKENVRQRTKSKGRDQLPKLILKRKKSHSHWLLAASAVMMPVLVLLVAGYLYSFGRN
ncbi:hypothetical protein Taro_039511 [Colocasia esculenta]|uniref:Proton pump-interactor 1 n=1 Tax=Colocasia esculenta TaxID=4460 RepID=A0A843WMG7_COLES|nr:hypothetical protein [Colocasia esculenta]